MELSLSRAGFEQLVILLAFTVGIEHLTLFLLDVNFPISAHHWVENVFFPRRKFRLSGKSWKYPQISVVKSLSLRREKDKITYGNYDFVSSGRKGNYHSIRKRRCCFPLQIPRSSGWPSCCCPPRTTSLQPTCTTWCLKTTVTACDCCSKN